MKYPILNTVTVAVGVAGTLMGAGHLRQERLEGERIREAMHVQQVVDKAKVYEQKFKYKKVFFTAAREQVTGEGTDTEI